MTPDIVFDANLVRKYDRPGPRYTSYPTAPQFTDAFTEADYLEQIRQSNTQAEPRFLSLYFHIPFCQSLCFYCGCNKIITHNNGRAVDYLVYLKKEIALQARHFGKERVASQLHFGGGTPTFLENDQMQGLTECIDEHFAWTADAERSIEVDPRTVSPDDMAFLAKCGFNRMSMGIQDFDPAVQIAVNRIQGEKPTRELVEAARASGFGSISYDLIYGLPKQTHKSFANTLETVIGHRPDRLAIYSYAHLPQLIKSQKLIRQEDLPTPDEKLGLLQMTIERLAEAGYVYIGMDHFALADDSLTKALRDGSLQRNFQGYSTHADTDLIGFGMSSIGSVNGGYSQNQRYLKSYYDLLDNDRLPLMRGLIPTAEDRLRRTVIGHLMCQGVLDFAALGQQFDIDFARHFAREIERLKPMEADGLVELAADAIRVQPLGRLLIRNIAMVFDEYLAAPKGSFSRTV